MTGQMSEYSPILQQSILPKWIARELETSEKPLMMGNLLPGVIEDCLC
jgi:hypothetical protein